MALARAADLFGGIVTVHPIRTPGLPYVLVAPDSGDVNAATFPMVRHVCAEGQKSTGHRTSATVVAPAHVVAYGGAGLLDRLTDQRGGCRR